MIDFTTVKDLSIALNFDTLVKLVTQNSLIHYKVLKRKLVCYFFNIHGWDR